MATPFRPLTVPGALRYMRTYVTLACFRRRHEKNLRITRGSFLLLLCVRAFLVTVVALALQSRRRLV